MSERSEQGREFLERGAGLSTGLAGSARGGDSA